MFEESKKSFELASQAAEEVERPIDRVTMNSSIATSCHILLKHNGAA